MFMTKTDFPTNKRIFASKKYMITQEEQKTLNVVVLYAK